MKETRQPSQTSVLNDGAGFFFDQWLSYRDLIFKCPKFYAETEPGEGGTDRRRKREENERGLGVPRGPRGPRDINISCKAGKAGLTIFRKAKVRLVSQTLTVAGLC